MPEGFKGASRGQRGRGGARKKLHHGWEDYDWQIQWLDETTFKVEYEGMDICDAAVADWIQVADAQIKSYFGEKHPDLTMSMLNFSCNKITDKGIITLVDFLCRCHISVDKIMLHKNAIQDEGASAIGRLLVGSATRPVQEVHLSHNRVCNKGICAIMDAVRKSERYPYNTERWCGSKPGSKRQTESPLWLRVENNTFEPRVLEYYLNKHLQWCSATSRHRWQFRQATPMVCLHETYSRQKPAPSPESRQSRHQENQANVFEIEENSQMTEPDEHGHQNSAPPSEAAAEVADSSDDSMSSLGQNGHAGEPVKWRSKLDHTQKSCRDQLPADAQVWFFDGDGNIAPSYVSPNSVKPVHEINRIDFELHDEGFPVVDFSNSEDEEQQQQQDEEEEECAHHLDEAQIAYNSSLNMAMQCVQRLPTFGDSQIMERWCAHVMTTPDPSREAERIARFCSALDEIGYNKDRASPSAAQLQEIASRGRSLITANQSQTTRQSSPFIQPGTPQFFPVTQSQTLHFFPVNPSQTKQFFPLEEQATVQPSQTKQFFPFEEQAPVQPSQTKQFFPLEELTLPQQFFPLEEQAHNGNYTTYQEAMRTLDSAHGLSHPPPPGLESLLANRCLIGVNGIDAFDSADASVVNLPGQLFSAVPSGLLNEVQEPEMHGPSFGIPAEVQLLHAFRQETSIDAEVAENSQPTCASDDQESPTPWIHVLDGSPLSDPGCALSEAAKKKKGTNKIRPPV